MGIIRREPFMIIAVVVLFTTMWRYDFDLPLWTMPIAISGWLAACLADDMWQAHLDRPLP